MSCGCGKFNDTRSDGSQDNLFETLMNFGEPTWKNVIIWLSFILAVMTFLRR